ncbi:winged helix-turn-helix transcriptional regulator [Taibaiella koreensis]|uniref:winged helix-turn-helix transcriptional regulator n=1 Tax=Taibaiella koreensis TaxID=1268548 RepID=UPI000E59A1BE|nr:helix-turn-helix domain-containing protein [Taibaiella koreensis]
MVNTSNPEVTTKSDQFRLNECAMHRCMAVLGTKWKPIIIWMLRDRTARFGQLAAVIGLISRKVLTTSLKELEEDGIIIREEYKELPPRVEYRLSERGKALLPIMQQLYEWTLEGCNTR